MSLVGLLAATVHCLWAAAGGRQDEAKMVLHDLCVVCDHEAVRGQGKEKYAFLHQETLQEQREISQDIYDKKSMFEMFASRPTLTHTMIYSKLRQWVNYVMYAPGPIYNQQQHLYIHLIQNLFWCLFANILISRSLICNHDPSMPLWHNGFHGFWVVHVGRCG